MKKVEAVKKTEELRKSKQELLEKLIEEQKNLILKLEGKKGLLKAEENLMHSNYFFVLATVCQKVEKFFEISSFFKWKH